MKYSIVFLQLLFFSFDASYSILMRAEKFEILSARKSSQGNHATSSKKTIQCIFWDKKISESSDSLHCLRTHDILLYRGIPIYLLPEPIWGKKSTYFWFSFCAGVCFVCWASFCFLSIYRTLLNLFLRESCFLFLLAKMNIVYFSNGTVPSLSW